MAMRFACWVIKAADTHSEYVILIASSLQQWLHEGALMLRCAYIACLVISKPFSSINIYSVAHKSLDTHV